MKAAILYADLITTVSERYARGDPGSRGIRLRARGGAADAARRSHRHPERHRHGGLGPGDRSLDSRTTTGPPTFGPKRENKIRLLEAMELPVEPEVPVIGIISRLVDQKGFDLFEEAANV